MSTLREVAEPVVAAVFDEQLGRPVLVEGAPLLKHGQPLYTAQPTPSGDAEDAARYRWLRKNELMAKIQYMTPPTPEGIDAAIDARRKEGKL